MKIVKLLANLGYGSRREIQILLRRGAVTNSLGQVLTEKDFPPFEEIRFYGEELDPQGPLMLVINKPDGYTCSKEDHGHTVYELIPERFERRNPSLNPVGRLDKDTTGLLLMTDDGKLLHRLIHPKSGCRKRYLAQLDRPLNGDEVTIFASGDLLLRGENKPLLPAGLEVISPTEVIVSLHEGRYHQVRRMFAALGNHVTDLKRISMGGFTLPNDLAPGEWRFLNSSEIATLQEPVGLF